MDVEYIKSYLVKLGYDIDHPALRKFDDAVRQSSQLLERAVGGMAKTAVASGAAVVGSLTGIATATLGVMSNVANADLEFNMFARRMYLTTDQARHMKIALDALGVSAEDVIFGPPELQERYKALTDLQGRMEARFGGTGEMEKRLKQFRDLEFRFTMFKVGIGQLARGFTASLFTKLFGDGKAQDKLDQLIDKLVKNTPRWADELSSGLKPILMDVKDIWLDLIELGKDGTSMFLRFIGLIYGDDTLQRGEVNLKNVAKAIEHIADSVKKMLDWLRAAGDYISKNEFWAKVFVGTAGGAAVGSVVPGVGTIAGGVVGGIGTAAYDVFQKRPGDAAAGRRTKASMIADLISRRTGIPAPWLFGQFEHETGDFTNRGALKLNNLAGIRLPGSTEYRNFGNLNAFADYYTQLIQSSRYADARNAKTDVDFVAGLKRGGYFEDNQANYLRGVQRGEGMYVGSVTVHVSQPNATPEQIANAVLEGIHRAQEKETQRTMLQLSGVHP